MKRSTSDVETILFEAIAPIMEGQISGSVELGKRMDNSVNEDVIIGVYAINTEQFQRAKCYINIHVPNQEADDGPGPGSQMPDKIRMAELTELLMSVEYSSQEWRYHVTEQKDVYDETSGNWFVHFELDFRFLLN